MPNGDGQRDRSCDSGLGHFMAVMIRKTKKKPSKNRKIRKTKKNNRKIIEKYEKNTKKKIRKNTKKYEKQKIK